VIGITELTHVGIKQSGRPVQIDAHLAEGKNKAEFCTANPRQRQVRRSIAIALI